MFNVSDGGILGISLSRSHAHAMLEGAGTSPMLEGRDEANELCNFAHHWKVQQAREQQTREQRLAVQAEMAPVPFAAGGAAACSRVQQRRKLTPVVPRPVQPNIASAAGALMLLRQQPEQAEQAEQAGAEQAECGEQAELLAGGGRGVAADAVEVGGARLAEGAGVAREAGLAGAAHGVLRVAAPAGERADALKNVGGAGRRGGARGARRTAAGAGGRLVGAGGALLESGT